MTVRCALAISLVSFLSACVVTPYAAEPLSAQDRRPDPPAVILFEDIGFYGDAFPIAGRRDLIDLDPYRWGGEARSVQIRRGAWAFCEYPEGRGFCVYLERDAARLEDYGFGERIRSVVRDVAYEPPSFIVYEEDGFRGGARKFFSEAPDLNAFDIDGRVESIRFGRGVWRLCTRAYGRGFCRDVEGDQPNLARIGLGRRVSSIAYVGRGAVAGRHPGGRPAGPGRGPDRERVVRDPGLILYEDAGFRGRAVPLDASAPDLARYGGENRASSLRVFKGRWELCDQPNYGGVCITVDADLGDGDLRRLGMHDRIASARRLPDGSRGDRDRGGPGREGRGRDREDDRGGPSPAREPQIVLYRNGRYSGRALPIAGDTPSLRPFDFDNRMTSVRVLEGTWELCEHPNYGGSCTTIAQDEDYTGRPFNDALSSLRRIDD